MTLIAPDYTYDCRIVRVIDGDTFDAELSRDIGFRCRPTWRQILRPIGINCPEMTGASKALGVAARAYAEQWLAAEALTVETVRQENFGRWLAHIRRADGSSLADALVAAGHAVKWAP